MAKSNDEIYDLLVAVEKKVDTHIAVATWRMTRLEERAARPWQLWLAVAGAALALPISIVAAVTGAGAN